MVSIDELKTLLETSMHLSVTVKRPRRMFVAVPRDQLCAVAGFLAQSGVQHLSTITGRDAGTGFEVLYHFFVDGTVLTLKVQLPRDDPVVDSIVGLFPSSVLYERELLDLLGITPRGHPDLRRLVLPDDWPGGYPLRKDWKPSQEEPHA